MIDNFVVRFHRGSRYTRRSVAAALVMATVAAGSVVALTVQPAFATSFSIGPSKMEGALKVLPGNTLRAGYDFTIPGGHPAATVQFVDPIATFPVKCVNGSTPTQPTITIDMGTASYSAPLNDSNWFPSGDQSSPLVYQGSISVPDVCNGGQISLADGGTFTTDLRSAYTAGNAIHVRWHYGIKDGTSWSATVAGTGSLSFGARIQITPAKGANQVGRDHVLTVTVTKQSGVNPFVPANSANVTASITSGPGSFKNGVNTCATGAGGTCTVTIVSTQSGLTTVSASADVPVNGATVKVTTNGQNGNSGPAVKRWINVLLDLTPDTAVNQINHKHVFTAHLTFDYGVNKGFVDAPDAEKIDFEILPGGAGTLSAASCTTTGGTGACTVELNSSVTGTTNVKASWHGDVVTAEGTAQASAADTASKIWVNALIMINPPKATNEVTKNHVFTISVSKVAGGITSPATGVTVTATITSGPGSFVGGNTCVSNGSGTCTVTLHSDATGVTTVKATATVTVEGRPVDVAADGQGTNAPPAVKHWVNARLSLTPPTATNIIGDTHTFTALLEFDYGTGQGFLAAPNGQPIHLKILSGPGTLHALSCLTGAAGAGMCTVTLDSSTTGLTKVQADWSGVITVDGEASATIARSATADKHWVNALITINPPEATNEIGANHVFTITVKNSDQGAFSAASGVVVTATIASGPGSFVGSNTCKTDNLGECTVTLHSTETGLTTVRAEATVTVDGKPIAVSTNGKGGNAPPAIKRWVDARLSITPPLATNVIGDPHTFTTHLKIDFGAGRGFVDAPAGEVISLEILSGPGSFVRDTCSTNGSGVCTTVLNSSVRGTTQVKATWAGSITTAEGTTFVDRAATATKIWIPPTAVLPVLPQARLPKTGFNVIGWVALAMTLVAIGLTMIRTSKEWDHE